MAASIDLEKTRIPLKGSATVTVCIVFWIYCAAVYGYDDLREISCLNITAYKNIPPKMASWFGTLTVTFECDYGYDFSLNSPVNSTLTCMPDGSTWQPDYLPDCNPKMWPETVNMTIKGYMEHQTCSERGEIIIIGNLMAFTAWPRINISEKCRIAQLSGCTLLQADMKCFDENHSGNQHGPTSSHIFVKIQFGYSNRITWSAYNQTSSNVGLSILKDIDPEALPSNANVSLAPECKNNALPVLIAGSEVVCRGCSLGHYLDKEKKQCRPCSPGSYGDTPLSTSCKLCPGMESLFSNSTWLQINKVVPDRASDLYGCPVLFNHLNGTVEVKLFRLLKANSVLPEMKYDAPPGTLKDNTTFLILVIGVAVLCSLLAVTFLAFTHFQETRRRNQDNRDTLAENANITYHFQPRKTNVY